MTCNSLPKSKFASVCPDILVAVLALAVVGCGPLECTQVGCDETVMLDLQESVPFGEYRLTLETDGRSDSCVVRLSDEPDPGDSCNLPGVLFFKDSISVNAKPESLSVTVEHVASGETVSQKYRVDYEMSYPNGKECGPECETARLDLDTRSFAAAVRTHESSSLGGAGGMSSSDE